MWLAPRTGFSRVLCMPLLWKVREVSVLASSWNPLASRTESTVFRAAPASPRRGRRAAKCMLKC